MKKRNRTAIAAALHERQSSERFSGEIKGLAQTIANPTYNKLLTAEPLLRKAVPILILAFIVTIVVGAVVQSIDSYQQAIRSAEDRAYGVGEILSGRIADLTDRDLTKALSDSVRAEPQIRLAADNFIVLITDNAGIIRATEPAIPSDVGRPIAEFIAEKRTTGNAQLKWTERLFIGNEPIGFKKSLRNGQLFVIQTRADALTNWRHNLVLTFSLTLTTSFVVLVIGFAFHWQSTRAREADIIYETVRSRIDAALTLGRCGLWSWNLKTNQVYWSASMFEILGLKAEDRVLSFDEIEHLLHPADIKLDELRSGAAVERILRMLHAQRGWVSVRLRFEQFEDRDGVRHLIGAAAELSSDTSQSAHNQTPRSSRIEDAFEYTNHQHLTSKADRLANDYVSTNGAVELVGLANHLGVKVYFADVANSALASISRNYTEEDNSARCEIYLDRSLPIAMRRWLLAKELANFLTSDEDGNVSEAKLEAVAMELALPSQPFRYAWERIRDEEALGEWFQVPESVVRNRISELNLHSLKQ